MYSLISHISSDAPPQEPYKEHSTQYIANEHTLCYNDTPVITFARYQGGWIMERLTHSFQRHNIELSTWVDQSRHKVYSIHHRISNRTHGDSSTHIFEAYVYHHGLSLSSVTEVYKKEFDKVLQDARYYFDTYKALYDSIPETLGNKSKKWRTPESPLPLDYRTYDEGYGESYSVALTDRPKWFVRVSAGRIIYGKGELPPKATLMEQVTIKHADGIYPDDKERFGMDYDPSTVCSIVDQYDAAVKLSKEQLAVITRQLTDFILSSTTGVSAFDIKVSKMDNGIYAAGIFNSAIHFFFDKDLKLLYRDNMQLMIDNYFARLPLKKAIDNGTVKKFILQELRALGMPFQDGMPILAQRYLSHTCLLYTSPSPRDS